jgi:MFS family permease
VTSASNEDSEVLRRLYWLTFIESVGTVLLERGLYFYTQNVLAFSEAKNLWLALAFGVTYVAGAVSSHRVSMRVSERGLLLLALFALLAIHFALTVFPQPALLMAAFPVVGLLQGIKWPVVESFISAGRAPAELVRVLGRFNTTWAVAVPLALVISGPLIASAFPASLFAAAGGLNAVALAFVLPLPARPLHLDHSHPERPNTQELRHFSALLLSARWAMLLSYTLLFLLAPLMPSVLSRLALSVSEATSAAGLLDFARVVSFAVLGAWLGWRGRAWPLLLSIALLPLSFAAILFGTSLPLLLCGEVLFGVASGITYTASLYYALLVKNASVDAGGAHEGLIGLGFALGPLIGLAGQALSPALGNTLLATLASLAPVALLSTLLALRALRPRLGDSAAS